MKILIEKVSLKKRRIGYFGKCKSKVGQRWVFIHVKYSVTVETNQEVIHGQEVENILNNIT